MGPQVCDDIDECAADNGACGSERHFSCVNNWGAAATCTEVCLSVLDPGFASVQAQAFVANFSAAGNPCAPVVDENGEANFWECQPECLQYATVLSEHGCYPLYLSNLRRDHATHLAMMTKLDAEYRELNGANKLRPTEDDPPSLPLLMLGNLQNIQGRCFDTLLDTPNSTHLYRNLLPVLPCEATGVTHRVDAILAEFQRTCPMDGSRYTTQQWFDERVGSYTRNQWIDINVTHTVCNDDVCAASMLATAASLHPMMSVCRDRIGTDTHYWSASSLTLLSDSCPGNMVGGRVARLLSTCAAIGPGPGPGHFPSPAVPCSLECSALIRSEKNLLEDLAATPVRFHISLSSVMRA